MVKLINSSTVDASPGPARNKVIAKIYSLSMRQKKLILILVDVAMYLVAIYFAYLLRIGTFPTGLSSRIFPVLVAVPIIAVSLQWTLGFYKTIIRSFDFRSLNGLVISVVFAGFSIVFLQMLMPQLFVPRLLPFIFVLIAFFLVAGSRFLFRWYYQHAQSQSVDRKMVLVYGAGEAGNRIATMISGSSDFALVGFIDDNPGLQDSMVRGRRVYSPDNLEPVIAKYPNIQVLISILNLSKEEKRSIFEKMSNYGIEVNLMPSLKKALFETGSLEMIREMQLEDVLGRDTVSPISSIYENAIAGQTILITGGAGSIGSEIFRQLLSCSPAKMIVLDQNELSIYQLQREYEQMKRSKLDLCDVIFQLGSVQNECLIEGILAKEKPNTVFHAASYKHVPIVENNSTETIRNNIIGTSVIVKACEKAGIERFVLVSTDKAVRPTSIMGATKRVAELIVLAHAKNARKTIFSIVRFGNVLGSSGSIVPLFREQLQHGGPLTVTHKDITRYFMTIEEAAQLVIQAGYLAEGGEVFLLAMGEPVKIVDLAKLFARLNGKIIRDEQNPDGSIAIEFIGLRPGEKLHEELYYGEKPAGTVHPKILKSVEKPVGKREVDKVINRLQKAGYQSDADAARKVLSSLVEFAPVA